MTTTEIPPGQVSDQAAGRVITLLCVASFLAMLDVSIVSIAFTNIADDFPGSSLADLSWVLNGYAITYAALLIPAGRLADRFGRKHGFLIGLGVFTLASLGCALSPTVWTLVAFRVLQAAGAALLTPAALGLMLTVLPEARRGGAIKIFATSSAFAGAVGPVVGGALAQSSWRWAFLINLPIGLVALVLANREVPAQPRAERTPIPDPLGAVLLAVAMGTLSLGLVNGGTWGWSSRATLVTFAVTVLSTAWVAHRLRHHTTPIIDPVLWRDRTFRSANISTLLFMTAFGALFLSVALWLETAAGMEPLVAGLAIAPGPLAVPIAAAYARRIAPTMAVGRLIACGDLIFVAGALLLAFSATSDVQYVTQVLPGWVLAGIGIGVSLPLRLGTATAQLPGHLAATGSAVINASRQLGYVLGVAALVAIVGSLSASGGSLDDFQKGWAFVALVAGLSAATALGIRQPRAG